MRYTYFNTAQTSPAVAQALDPQAGSDDDRVLKKIIIGAPVSARSITVYNKTNAVFGASTDIAFKHTFPSFSTTNVNLTPVQIDFTCEGGREKGANGLVLQGGSFTTDQAMQVTFLW